MPETRRVLAQSNPAATTLTAAYTVAAGTQAIVSSATVCNRGTADATFRISVAVAGAADTARQYVYYDIPLPGADTFAATLGITLGAADVIRVYASTADLAFNFFGVQIT